MDKIQGKFYPIKHEEWGRIYNELTKSQIGVLIYIRTLDPYGNGINIRASQIANFLNISRNAVYEAIRVLCEKDYLQVEDIEYTMRLYHKGVFYSNDNNDSSKSVTQSSSGDDTNNSQMTKITPGLQQPSGDDTNNSQMTKVTPGLQPEAETPDIQETQEPKNNKNYKNFKESLSNEEKESFLKFGLEKAKQLPKPPQLPNKWIAANWEEIRDEWLLATNQPTKSQVQKWENHPNREEWLDKINTLGFGAFIVENGDFDDERKEFVDWANASGLIEY